MEYTFTPIGHIRSCFKEKFGIPRQSGLVPEAVADLEIEKPFASKTAFRELGGFSHVWLIFVFHKNASRGWRPTVRPPRLGGNRRIGVFASRSGFRPNPVGMSAVVLSGITSTPEKTVLHLKGIDLVDGTPVLDVKPYLAYADSIPAASEGFTSVEMSQPKTVRFSPEALACCQAREAFDLPNLKTFIVQMLQNDPRPAYYTRKPTRNNFGATVFDLEVKWEVFEDGIMVTTICPSGTPLRCHPRQQAVDG